MYFSIGPKERLKDFYNYKKEYKKIKEAIKRKERIIVIQGVRRIGKTSLMNILFNELEGTKIWADGRIIKESKDILNIILEGIKNKGGIFGSIKSIGISIAGIELTAETNINEQRIKKVKKIFLFIDEAQYGNSYEIAKALSYLYDRFPNITTIISGSEIRIMEEVLGIDKAEHPLFGRHIEIITMKRLKEEDSINFLKKGFKELKFRIKKDEILEAVERLDGLVGWLSLYGYEKAIVRSKNALEKVENIALNIVKNEIKQFLKNKRNKKLFLAILKYASKRRWNELLSLIRNEIGTVNKSSFSRALKELMKYSFIEKEEEYYVQADPMVKEAAIRWRY